MKKYLKIITPVLIIVVAIAGASYIAQSGKPPETVAPKQPALLVDVIRPRIEDGPFLIHAQGPVTPRNETALVAEVSGKINWMAEDFVPGGVFKSGEVLARIDPSDYETALLAAQAELAAAQATLTDEQARSEAAREDFERLYGDTRDPGPLLLRLPQVARAKAAAQAQQAAVAQAERNLERTRIRIPFHGMIRERNINLGQYVSVGGSLGATFAVDRAEVRLPLSERDLAFLDIPAVGAQMDFERPVVLTGSFAGQPARWPASLVRTEGVVNQNTRLTYAVAEVVDPYALEPGSRRTPLPMGTFVEAQIEGRDASGLVVLPSQAIHNGNQIYIANEQDQLEVFSVEVVRATPRMIYIDSSLSPTDRVITTAIPAPVPGLKLEAREAVETEPRLRLLPADEIAASESENP
ncbi:MAG: efflux RND transporter periplasmic adaptor subunit [Wenzhouxiangellaceae bacterium]|nr:efflux RND transporter periplasmic adaptor subunit [Wenzhouxiangellaceae bacterium]